MPREDHIELLQGTLDLIVLRTLSTMGALHAYSMRRCSRAAAFTPATWPPAHVS